MIFKSLFPYYFIKESGKNKGEISLCITPQVLLEYFAVVTSSKRVAKPIEPKQAIEEITKYFKAENIMKIYPKEGRFEKIIDLSKNIRFEARKYLISK